MRITANSFMPVEAKIIIDGKYYTGEEFNRLVEALRAPSLTDDQQVVLEWLKERFERKDELTEILWELVDGTLADECYSIYGQAWKRLSKAQQFQVLAAFAEWGLSTLDN